ncbi:receptor expression-enhancing protein 5-like isoform X2 [Ptychodera flava]|uniref:receptor expression-enhancing protein 5-like isoform X2 n=1 Tax=Ptychodera flava TaxID=63121 RepID=UPI003969DA91
MASTETETQIKAQAQTVKEKFEKFLYEKNAFTEILEKIEKKTGVKRTYFCGAVVVIFAVYLIFGYGASFLCNLVGFLYPAYCSVKAIESESKDDDTQWLTYWVVYSAFSLAEFFSDIFLSWFPFYYLAKLAFLAWCMAPIQSNGSQFLYHRVIKPFVLKHQKQVDEALDKVQGAFDKAEEAARQAASDAAAKAAADAVSSSLNQEQEPEGDKKTN